MTGRFQSFVVFAEMRTGSNFLEANLNAMPGVACHGEAFNPHFMGYPDSQPILGVTLAAREKDPQVLLDAIRGQEGLGGFRYFHDHDPRIFEAVMADESCAKIILTRNPVESYVSWKIAQATGQWKLTHVKARKVALADFDAHEFQRHLEALQQFQMMLLRRLQVSGQTAFYVAYEDLQDLEVINGLGRFLGVPEGLDALDQSLKKQNPSAVGQKVRNAPQMAAALAQLDRFDLGRTPNFEPRRGPNVPSYVAGDRVPLLYLPIRGGPVEAVQNWLADLEGQAEALKTGMTQKDLRQWKRGHPGHRSFTVLRHPVVRAHDAFCRHLLMTGPGTYGALRNTLRRRYDVPLPEDGPGPAYDAAAHREGFAGFLRFLKMNIAGQTSVRVDATWCTQVEALRGFGDLALPDRLVREADLADELTALAEAVGAAPSPGVAAEAAVGPVALDQIYDPEIEALTVDAYQRDYLTFGFERWK